LTDKTFADAVFRLGEVKISFETPEGAIGMHVNRDERHRSKDYLCAQVNIPEARV